VSKVTIERELLERWRDAFAEELSAYDIEPPIHHVKQSHDEICAALQVTQAQPSQVDVNEQGTNPVASQIQQERRDKPASDPMTDEELAILNERGAKAWAGVNPQDLRDGSYAEPIGINGLTQAETDATMSVRGLIPKRATWPAV